MCENILCYGYDLKNTLKKRSYEINLNWIIQAKIVLGDSVDFINQPAFFNRLAGNTQLQQQILSGVPIKDIRTSWKPGLDNFKKIRQRYLLYD